MASVTELGDKIAGLTIAQAVELKNYLKDKYGSSRPPAASMMAAAGGGGGGAGRRRPPKPTEFNVILERLRRGQEDQRHQGRPRNHRPGPAEAKATVEGAPKPIKENVDKKTAEDVKKKLEEAGAKVTRQAGRLSRSTGSAEASPGDWADCKKNARGVDFLDPLWVLLLCSGIRRPYSTAQRPHPRFARPERRAGSTREASGDNARDPLAPMRRSPSIQHHADARENSRSRTRVGTCAGTPRRVRGRCLSGLPRPSAVQLQ